MVTQNVELSHIITFKYVGEKYRVIFLTGPPLRMSLDWPPPKMPRLAPPKSCKYENHIGVLRHLDFF